jgi:hypothetical protein
MQTDTKSLVLAPQAQGYDHAIFSVRPMHSRALKNPEHNSVARVLQPLYQGPWA